MKTIELTEGKILEVFQGLMEQDDSVKELVANAPEIVAVIGIMLLKIELKLFIDEPDNNTLS